ncbi:hypothetical protein MQM1_019 [Aeromonas phage vB_AsaP_MQM1]|nr:hypothetical protein MQM1_019 [Aeromonas phage vB_AsaP_MQM1]
MQFLYDMAAQVSEQFKDTADAVWDAVGPSHRGSGKLKEAQRTAGKYALVASLGMMLNFPDNADLFRDTFNLTGPGPTGADGFLEDESLASMGRVIGRTAAISSANNAQALMAQGYADVGATSTLEDIEKMLPMLVMVSDVKGGR